MKLVLIFLLSFATAYGEGYLKPKSRVGSPKEKPRQEEPVPAQSPSEPYEEESGPVKIQEPQDEPHHAISPNARSWAVLTGVNFSFAAAEPAKGGTPRTAWALRGAVDFPLNSTFSIEPSLAYVQRGAHGGVVQVGILTLNGDVKLNFIEISALLKMRKWFRSTRFEIWGGAGPGYGFAVTREFETLGGFAPIDPKTIFGSSDLLAIIGGGMVYHLGDSSRVLVQGRFTIGFNNLDQRVGAVYNTRGFELLFGFAFVLG